MFIILQYNKLYCICMWVQTHSILELCEQMDTMTLWCMCSRCGAVTEWSKISLLKSISYSDWRRSGCSHCCNRKNKEGRVLRRADPISQQVTHSVLTLSSPQGEQRRWCPQGFFLIWNTVGWTSLELALFRRQAVSGTRRHLHKSMELDGHQV